MLSLVIIMTSAFFVGMVIGLQGYDSLSRLRQEDILGAGVALTLFKELGPVVTALLFAGRAGTALASEIGLMRATDQLSAMEVMAIDPIRRIVAPRFLGRCISVPLLTTVFNAIGILGAWFIGVRSWASTTAPSGRRCRSSSTRRIFSRASPRAWCSA